MAQIKSYDTFQNVKDHIKKGRILSKGAELTVSSAGSITVTDSYHLVKGATDQDALTDILGEPKQVRCLFCKTQTTVRML